MLETWNESLKGTLGNGSQGRLRTVRGVLDIIAKHHSVNRFAALLLKTVASLAFKFQ